MARGGCRVRGRSGRSPTPDRRWRARPLLPTDRDEVQIAFGPGWELRGFEPDPSLRTTAGRSSSAVYAWIWSLMIYFGRRRPVRLLYFAAVPKTSVLLLG